MKLIKWSKSDTESAPLTFWQLALRFLGITAGTSLLGYASGYAIRAGFTPSILALPRATLVTLLVSLIAGWVPLGFYYEGHRFRWIYVVAYWIAALLAALFIGYSVAGTR